MPFIETGEQSAPNADNQAKQIWSIISGGFHPETDFPDPTEIDVIKGQAVIHPIRKTQMKVACRELLYFAMKEVGQVLPTDPQEYKRSVKVVIEETVENIVLSLTEEEYELGLNRQFNSTDMPPEDQVPVMQAVAAMEDSGAINHTIRTILDATVRGIYIRQLANGF